MIFDNHEDKIKFIKEWLDDILQSLEIHPNRNVQRQINNLWTQFVKENVKFTLRNMT